MNSNCQPLFALHELCPWLVPWLGKQCYGSWMTHRVRQTRATKDHSWKVWYTSGYLPQAAVREEDVSSQQFLGEYNPMSSSEAAGMGPNPQPADMDGRICHFEPSTGSPPCSWPSSNPQQRSLHTLWDWGGHLCWAHGRCWRCPAGATALHPTVLLHRASWRAAGALRATLWAQRVARKGRPFPPCLD